jgi:hypothetical protein
MSIQVVWTDLNLSDGNLRFDVNTSPGSFSDTFHEFLLVNAINDLLDPEEPSPNIPLTNPADTTSTYQLTFNPFGGDSFQDQWSFAILAA